MPTAIRPFAHAFQYAAAAAAAAALAAGDLDAYFSNQSADGPITLSLDEADAERGDVYFSLLNRPADRGPRPAPVLLQGAQRSQTLAPGQTAVLHLLAAPVAGSRAERAFRVRQGGRAGHFDFTFRVALLGGLPYAEARPDPGSEQRAELTRADPDLLIFWNFRPPGDPATTPASAPGGS
jgi:hypothetical protein